MSRPYTTIVLLTIIFAILRCILPTNGLNSADVFKDLAHCFVGGLFGAAITTKQLRFWALAIGLTVLEVIAALVR